MTDWAIREATIEDVPAVAEVHLSSWRSAYRGIVPDALLEALTVHDFVTRWTRDFDALPEGGLSLATAQDGRPIGFARSGRARGADLDAATTGEVQAIHVLPERVGTGLGRALFGLAIDRVRALGCREGVLWVLEGNTRARDFYERAGWRADGTRRERTFEAAGCAAIVPEVRYRVALASSEA